MTPEDLTDVIAADPGGTVLVLDFDGTLAPIVDDPTASAMPAEVGEALAGLTTVLRQVAIVSGRPAAFLAERVDVRGVRLLGLYGTQEWRDGAVVAHPETVRWESALDEARDRFTLALAGHPGVVLEDKGLAVALHWRNAQDRSAAAHFVTQLVDDVAADTGLAVEPGKLVAELRPPVGWDKGTTVHALAGDHGVRLVVYAGDDLGDLPAFAAARRAGGFAVAVNHGFETAAEVLAGADVVMDATAGVAEWLRELAVRTTELGQG